MERGAVGRRERKEAGGGIEVGREREICGGREGDMWGERGREREICGEGGGEGA